MTAHFNESHLKAAAIPVHRVKLTLYVGFFTLGFIIASAILMMIQSKFTLNSQLVTALSIAVGAYTAVYKFIKHRGRAFDKKEITRLALNSNVILWLLTALYFLALWLFVFDAASRDVLMEMTRQQPMPLLLAIAMMIILTLLVAFFSIWLFNLLLNPNRKNI